MRLWFLPGFFFSVDLCWGGRGVVDRVELRGAKGHTAQPAIPPAKPFRRIMSQLRRSWVVDCFDGETWGVHSTVGDE